MKTQFMALILAIIATIPAVGCCQAADVKNHLSIQDKTTNHEAYIDPAIDLNHNHLSLLEHSVSYVHNEKIKTFLQILITTIKTKGTVDTRDIKEIILNNQLQDCIKSIHFLCFVRSNGRGYGYAYGFFPFLLYLLFNEFMIDEGHLGPASLIYWLSPDSNTRINGKKIYDNDPQQGYALGFFGHTFSGGTWPAYYHVFGLSTLVIITENEY